MFGCVQPIHTREEHVRSELKRFLVNLKLTNLVAHALPCVRDFISEKVHLQVERLC